MLSGKGRQHRPRYVGSLAMACMVKVDYCQCTIVWLKDSKLCRRATGPESLIHHKLGPWQWQSEPAFSQCSYSLLMPSLFYVAM